MQCLELKTCLTLATLAISLPPIPHTEKVVTGLQYHSQNSRSVSGQGLSLHNDPLMRTPSSTRSQEEVAFAAIVFNETVWLLLLLTAFLDAPADLGNSLCTFCELVCLQPRV